MLRRCLVRAVAYFEPRDVRDVVILKQLRNRKLAAGVRPEDIDDDELAREAGLVPPAVVDMDTLATKKAQLVQMLDMQRAKRLARRDAFLTWQAGQREKGAAHRLLRQAAKTERHTRAHYETQRSRLLPVQHTTAPHLTTANARHDNNGKACDGTVHLRLTRR